MVGSVRIRRTTRGWTIRPLHRHPKGPAERGPFLFFSELMEERWPRNKNTKTQAKAEVDTRCPGVLFGRSRMAALEPESPFKKACPNVGI